MVKCGCGAKHQAHCKCETTGKCDCGSNCKCVDCRDPKHKHR